MHGSNDKSSTQNTPQLVQKRFLPSAEEIGNLTKLEDIELILKDVIAREEQINEELNILLKESSHAENEFDSFENLPMRFKSVMKESKGLDATLEISCTLAKNVSKKVRDLDTIRMRVGEATKKVADIIDVKNCIEGVQRAMEREDYEEAAGHIQRFLNIDESVLENNTAVQQLRLSEQRLRDIISKKLDEAVRNNDDDSILRFCSLYMPLGSRDEGLTRYAHHLRTVCSAQADQIYKQLLRSLGHSHVAQDASEEVLTCTEAITRLFEGVAGIIDVQKSVVDRAFGPGSMGPVLKHLQMQTDIHATKIVDLFMENFRVIRLHDEIVAQKKRPESSQKDPREIAPILDEVAFMSQSAELFDRFIRRAAKEAAEEASPDGQNSDHTSPSEFTDHNNHQDHTNHQQSNNNNNNNNNSNTTITKNKVTHGLLHISELNRRMQELIGYYMMLEEFFMTESTKKAIRMDEPLEDSMTSSGVDYVFFVFQKSTHRALLSTNTNAICATINIVTTILTRDLKDYLTRTLENLLVIASQSSNSKSQSIPKMNYTVMLNNIEVSGEYVIKLRKEVESECQRVFNGIDVKVKSCLDDLTDASNTFKKLLQTNLEHASNILTPKIKPLLDSFAALSYDLTELEYAEREVNDPFVQQLIAGVDQLIKPFKNTLTSSNYDNLVHVLIRFVCQKIEHEVLRKKFNQLGGLQFDKEVRDLQNHFASMTQKTVRDKFARLSQMATLLYLEKVGEVLDYWGQNSGHMTWRLTPGEVRRVLSLRIDFSKEAIAKLKL